MRFRRTAVAAVGAAIFVATVASLVDFHPLKRSSGKLRHEAYVWQRRWDASVPRALEQASSELSAFNVLAAEVSWHDGRPHLVHVSVDYAALKHTGKPVGLSLRIGPWAGPFEEQGEATKRLVELAASLLDEARKAGLEPAEFQLDFDCAESRLEGYGAWVEALRKSTGNTPLTITALPCWLKHRAFGSLARATDGFVLQVHSLEPPAGPDTPMKLCDTDAVPGWVERAARVGKPFRVALPTYGYTAAFGADGRLVGLSAEGPSPDWTPEMTLRAVRSDPHALAGLVRTWEVGRPENLVGVVWYRLPVEGDRMNWTWTTLSAVISGGALHEVLEAAVQYVEPRLVEIELVNAGRTDASPGVRIGLEWEKGVPVASDGLGGFTLVETRPNGRNLEPDEAGAAACLRPGERRKVAWLRFREPTEVRTDVHPLHP